MSNDEARSSRAGLLFIVSAPSGTGKTTLVERLVQVVPNLTMSRSYTSRPARAGEQSGVDYNFISSEHFEAMVRQGAFLEWADVFGHFYGTSKADTDALLGEGRDVVLVIDVQGARQVRSRGIPSVGVFVLPPSAAILEQRLRGRSKDSEDQICQRLQVACREVDEYSQVPLRCHQRRARRGGRAPGVDRVGGAVACKLHAARRREGHQDIQTWREHQRKTGLSSSLSPASGRASSWRERCRARRARRRSRSRSVKC